MLKTAITATGLVLAATLPVRAIDEPFPVSEVEVATDLDGVSVSALEGYYPAFNEDLAQAIWGAVENPETDGGPGFEIDVKVTELSLDDGPMGPEGTFNRLEGIATYTYDGSPNPAGSFPIEVIATAGDAPAGMIVVPPSETDFYAAMLAAFADGVSRKVSDLPKPDPNRLTAD